AWDVRQVSDEQLATQGVLFATTAGARAKELRGRGVFSRALLRGLSGVGPDLLPPSAPPESGQPPRPSLEFDDLVKFVKAAVNEGLGTAQGPYGSKNPVPGDLTIAEFAVAQIPRVPLTFLVSPPDARARARIEFWRFSEDDNKWVPRTNPQPALPPLQE